MSLSKIPLVVVVIVTLIAGSFSIAIPVRANDEELRCEIAVDVTKWLKERPFAPERVMAPRLGFTFTGDALGTDYETLLIQVMHPNLGQTLETPRLRLRAWDEGKDDPLDLLVEMEADPAFHEYWLGYEDRSLRDEHGVWLPAIKLGELSLGHTWKPRTYDLTESFVIEDKSSGQMIGFIDVTDGVRHNDFRVSYGLFRNARGKGFAEEALRKILDSLVPRTYGSPIYAYVGAPNSASISVLSRAGFEFSDGFSSPLNGSQRIQRWYYPLPHWVNP